MKRSVLRERAATSTGMCDMTKHRYGDSVCAGETAHAALFSAPWVHPAV